MNQTELKMAPASCESIPEVKIWSRWKALRGQVWCEWYAHSKLLLAFIGVWLAGIWMLPLYGNPAWILFFGGAYAVLAGPIFGGSDIIDGCEEFVLTLPSTRGERYATRLFVGGGSLLLFTAMDLLALGLDLPQILAKLYIDSGLIHPWPVFKTGLLYSLVLTWPLAVFAVSFALSSISHSRRLILSASFWAVLVSLGVLWLGLWYEELLWDNTNGYFACPLLVILAVAALWGGARAYRRKEIGAHSAPIALPERWWLWGGLFFVGLLLGLVLAGALAKHWVRLFPGHP